MSHTSKLQRRILRLEEALQKILEIPNYTDGGDWEEILEAREIAAEALGTDIPPSTYKNSWESNN